MILREIWLKCRRTGLPFLERRRFLRLDASIPVKYSIITKEKHAMFHPAENLSASKNIGGGGLMLEVPLLVDEFLMTKNLLRVEIDLPDGESPIYAITKIVCIERDEHDDVYYLRMGFVEVSEHDVERAVKFVRHNLKKG